jgi:hypothetical protein
MKTETEAKIALDNSLRNLYIALRKAGCLLMAIDFEHGGTKYHVDTVAEAAELQHKLKQHDALYGSYRGESTQKVWGADLAMDLLNGIGELQKKFLAALSSRAELSSSTLVESIGIESEIALAGVVSGLSKQLRKMSINPTSLYSVEVIWKGKGKTRFFRLSSDFRDALIELGWPEAWQTGKGQDETPA